MKWIPQQYINEVKLMLVNIAGESHSAAYRSGASQLAGIDSRFAVTTFTASPPLHNAGDPKLRLGSFRRSPSGWQSGAGEGTYFTNVSAIEGIKRTIKFGEDNSNPLAVIGFGWCWDMTSPGPGGTEDPVWNIRWGGRSSDGPEGSRIWGLDSGDEVLTGNSVCMDTYLNAVEEYRQYCADNSYNTLPIFTTGPVDGNSASENGFQREIKHQYIRDFVQQDPDRILFDYADILTWNDSGEQNITNWNDEGVDRPHANIHGDNSGNATGHIGNAGALRLGKAMWWMLARIAGWDGTTSEPALLVTSPAGGEFWQKGTEHSVTWSSNNVIGNITIDLYKANILLQNIGNADVSDGSYSWSIPTDLDDGDDYTVRIYQDTTEDLSDTNFSITTDPVTFTVTFTAGSNGSLTGDFNQVIAYGYDCSAVTAAPDSGYRFSNWTIMGEYFDDYTSTENPLTITNVIRDMTITANFTAANGEDPGTDSDSSGGGGCFIELLF